MTIKVTGLKELEEKLIQLGSVAGEKAIRGSLYAAVKPISEQAKTNIANWPNGSGALALSMGRKYGKDKGGKKFSVIVQPKVKHKTAIALYNLFYKRRIKGIFYGHLLEFGHKDRSGGQVPAKPFLLPALRDKTEEAVSIFAASLKKKIERAMKK